MNIDRLRKLAGIAEGRPGRQKTVKLYHGTTSQFLSNIKKHGLLPNTGQQSFGSGSGVAYASYGGVYLTSMAGTAKDAAKEAADKFGGEPIVVTVQYVLGSGGLDEDFIFDTWWDLIDYVSDPTEAANEALERLEELTNLRENTDLLVREFFDIVNEIKNSKDEYDYDDDIRADPNVREIVKKIIESVKNRDIENTANVRLTRPVGWRGKTRIISIDRVVQ